MAKLNFDITPAQLLLLKAAVFPAEKAAGYWQQWKACHQLTDSDLLQDKEILSRIFDPLDRGSHRLMPLVYRNLEKSGDPIIKRMRGMYRHSWMRNQQHLYRIKEITRLLHEAGIETMLIKGLAMSLLYYRDLGVRYMNDIDLLVPFEKHEEALKVLLTSKLNLKIGAFDYYMKPYYHASHLYSEDGYDLDLHHHLLMYNRNKTADVPFWQNSLSLDPEYGIPSSVLSPTHQLFHNLIHGNFPDFDSPMRWVADCYVIYTQHAIDWEEVLQLAVDLRLVWPVREGLRLLTREFDLVLPEAVQHRLQSLEMETSEAVYRRFLYDTFHKRKDVRKYYNRSRFEYELYFKDYTQQSFLKWFVRKTVARTQALLFAPGM
ncbi:nucleotidyltransferase family protein [Telluribacter sp.]|jgi:hypothetical protein|uniref:nucleotidyltransferase family protein n=1 Tax=Telluribacter sp. TaxID=1978767 RepID=UPI002E0D438B|nr:nucleotidyltransferase family protein [Telluribacter sp.]